MRIKSLYIFICFFFLSISLYSNSNVDTSFAYYKKLNDAETRLIDYKDSDNDLQLKIQQLHEINKSRRKYKAQEVQLDILASRVANKMCKEAAEKKFTGHWNTKGEKPYHRYSFAGGIDHVAENAYGHWQSNDMPRQNKVISRLMYDGHTAFMKEKAPHDGHKLNCIDKGHNFVGIGFYITTNIFRYYEEFIDRYYIFEKYPSDTVKKGERITIEIAIPKDIQITSYFTSYEKGLKSMSPARIRSKGSYLDGSNKMEKITFSDNLQHPIYDDKYLARFHFTPKKSGIYYVHIRHKNLVKGKAKGDEIDGSGLIIIVD